MPQCKHIRVNHDDAQCKKMATPGWEYCRTHGGNRKGGIVNSNLKNGRYSRYLPESIQKNYEELLADPDLLDLSHEIAVLQALYGELIREVEAGGSRENWLEMKNLWGDFLMAVQSEDVDEQTECAKNINDMFDRADKNHTGLKQLQDMSDTIRKLSKDEQTRRVQNQTMIGVETVMVLLYAALASLKEAAYRHAEPAVAERIIQDAEFNHARLIGAGQSSG